MWACAMSVFKAGDEIYCLDFLDSLFRESDGEINICLMRGNVIDCDPFVVFAENGLGVIISDANHINYRTKNEAIDAIIAKLKELKE